MNKLSISMSSFISLAILSILVLNSACNEMSETIYDKNAGINGGFENVKNGLPVNWLVYTPNTVTEGDFKLIIDTVDYQEGKQSLKFDIQQCSDVGGWRSPGFSQEYKATTRQKYTISFWVKNTQSKFKIVIGGVNAFEGKYETIIESEESFPDWTKIGYDYVMPKAMELLRIELNILKPGIFWIDNIKIDGVEELAIN